MKKPLGVLFTLALAMPVWPRVQATPASASTPEATASATPAAVTAPAPLTSELIEKALFDGFVGGVAGGVLGAVITVMTDGKRKRREVSMKILERMVSEYHSIGEIDGLLQAQRTLSGHELNTVLAQGNWFDIVARLCREKIADEKLLKTAGIKKQFKEFLDHIANSNITNKNDLTSRANDWDQLKSFTEK